MSAAMTPFERRALVGLVVGIHVAIAVIRKTTISGEPFAPIAELPWSSMIIGTLFNTTEAAEVILLGVWMGLGRIPVAVRLPVALLALTLHLFFDDYITHWRQLLEQLTLFFVVTAPLLACRFRGLQVRVEGESESAGDMRRFQLWHLLVLTVGLSLVFALWRLYPPKFQKSEILGDWETLAIIGAETILPAGASLLGVWACLHRGAWQYALLLMAVTSLFAGFVLYQTAATLWPANPSWLLAMAFCWTALQAPWVSLTFAALRGCGYTIEFPTGLSAPPAVVRLEQTLASGETTPDAVETMPS